MTKFKYLGLAAAAAFVFTAGVAPAGNAAANDADKAAKPAVATKAALMVLERVPMRHGRPRTRSSGTHFYRTSLSAMVCLANSTRHQQQRNTLAPIARSRATLCPTRR